MENISHDEGNSYHFFNGLSECPPLDVFRDEVESLVFVEQSDELENVGVIQTAHHLHLTKTGQRRKGILSR